MTTKRLLVLGTVTAALLVVGAACMTADPPPAQTPPTINNITPITGGDSGSGLLVLLTVAGIVAFIGVIGAVVFGLLWGSERRLRGQYEDALSEYTGQPAGQLMAAAARQLRVSVPIATSERPALRERQR